MEDSSSPQPPSSESQAQPESSPYGDDAPPSCSTTVEATVISRPKRTIVRRRRDKQRHQEAQPVPITIDPVILRESNLPTAYSFEIPKTVQRILSLQATHVALQMPEGLLLYASVLADLLKRLCPKTLKVVSILGDVTYGACCVDDLGAQALGAQLLVHYGHSCLVPLQHTVVPCLYVFVEIQIDVPHMCDCLIATLLQQQSQQQQQEQQQQEEDKDNSKKKPFFIYLLGTIQFRHALVEAKELLLQLQQQQGAPQKQEEGGLLLFPNQELHVIIPQVKPLSPGEVLGCTSPRLDAHFDEKYNDACNHNNDNSNAIACFVADGRFHLEATLISNPHIATFYRYDPYGKALTVEAYDHDKMRQLRWNAIECARLPSTKTFGVILGTLGRQGNPAIVQRIRQVLQKHQKKHFLLLLSEITPQKLKLMANKVDAWVQVACPRLSVDWGHFLSDGNKQPVLTPYEFFCCMGEASFCGHEEQEDNSNQQQQQQHQKQQQQQKQYYPMDYYSYAGGPWSNYYAENKDRKLHLSQKQQT